MSSTFWFSAIPGIMALQTENSGSLSLLGPAIAIVILLFTIGLLLTLYKAAHPSTSPFARLRNRHKYPK